MKAVWGEEAIEKIDRLWQDGQSVREIARAFREKPVRAKTVADGWTPEFLGALSARWNGGATSPEIQAEFGLTKSQFTYIRLANPEKFAKKHDRGAYMREQGKAAKRPDARPIFPVTALPRIAEPVEAPASRPAPLYALSAHQCRFPLWGHADKPTVESLFCGAGTEGLASYCGFHHKRVGM
jgi:hypothetical protein